MGGMPTVLVYCRSMRSASGRLCLGLCLGVAAVLLLSGCGSASGDQGGDTPSTPQDLLLTQAQIKAVDPHTPARALLSWWQALQFDDTRSALKFYVPGITTESRLGAQLQVAGPPVLAKPEVEQIKFDGKRALIYAVIVSATTTKANQIDTIVRRPTTLRMIKKDGRWLFTDNTFLAQRAALALASQGAAK